MFKRYADFSGSLNHPGQPVHCDHDFDVWQDGDGEFFVITQGGERVKFPTIQSANLFASAEVAAESTKQH